MLFSIIRETIVIKMVMMNKKRLQLVKGISNFNDGMDLVINICHHDYADRIKDIP